MGKQIAHKEILYKSWKVENASGVKCVHIHCLYTCWFEAEHAVNVHSVCTCVCIVSVLVAVDMTRNNYMYKLSNICSGALSDEVVVSGGNRSLMTS